MPVKTSPKRLTRFLGVFLQAAALLIAHSSAHADESEAGAFFTQQFAPKTYGGSPQNWAAVQDLRGVMFFGNTSGVLEYDGAAWRLISLNGLPALSLAIDAKGTIFVGSQNDFGFLQPNGSGNLEFVSLAKRLPAADRHFGNVWTIACNKSSVNFTGQATVFRWKPAEEELTAVPAEGVFRSFSLDGTIYASFRKEGLSRIDGVRFIPVGGLESVSRGVIRDVTRFHDNILVATADALYRQQGNRFLPWRTDAGPILRNAVITSILPLRNGDLGISTIRSGLILLNRDGSLKRIFDKRSGLRSDAVKRLFEDRQQGLWLALDRGVARVEAESSLTSFGEREGLGEVIFSLQRFNGRMYAGTVAGLSYLSPAAPGLVSRFIPVEGIEETAAKLIAVDRQLLVGTASRIYTVENTAGHLILEAGTTYDMTRSARDPDIVYSVGTQGLYVLRRSGLDWRVIQHMKAPSGEFRSVIERPDGSLWIAARSTIYLADWKRQPVKLETFSKGEGVPAGWVNAYRINGQEVFSSTNGLLRFDEERRRFVPDLDFGKAAADGTHGVSIIRESRNGNIWISGDGYQAILQKQPGSGYRWIEAPLARAGIGELYTLYLDDDDTAWASGSDSGLVRYTNRSSEALPIPPLLLRRVEFLKSKQVLSNGEVPIPPSPTFQFADNALRFEFALPDFEDPSRTEYQVWLQGLSPDWSKWSKETEKEYTNLYEKSYTLQVRARSLHGVISAPAQFSFRIRPPWYRTWWSFILYFAALLGSVALIIKRRLSSLADANLRLENTIQERTQEIRAKEKEATGLLLNILPPQVADELRITGKVQPVTCGEVAICFTDFVGFTLSSETMTAQKLVEALDTYFRAFDDVIGRYQLEKLKTIGDAYMFVGGLPQPRKSFAVDTVLAALELVKIVERFADSEPGVGWKVRVGVNTGSAISGVVGSKKFAFDIWGNSVNLASRMESSGSANCVNISADTYHHVKDFIECEARGLVRTKEGRYMEMYFARRLKPEFHRLYEERFEKASPATELALQSEQTPSHSL